MSDVYARLSFWEVYNFASIKHGKAEFDERNIINFKGYNDSGKSTMMMALGVLMANIHPSKQAMFIQDGCEYFRVLAHFDNGITIIRDKYINGQSLYEMYDSNNVCMFSTKQGNTLTPVREVPEPIRDFLGLLQYGNMLVNIRSCFEKLLGVENSGSENYKMFNTVLKSEELAIASTLINNDKNKLVADMTSLENDLKANENIASIGSNLTSGMISYLKGHNTSLDDYDKRSEVMLSTSDLVRQSSEVIIYPAVQTIDADRVDALSDIHSLDLGIRDIIVYPSVDTLDEGKVNEIGSIADLVKSLEGISFYPEVKVIDYERVDSLNSMYSLFEEYARIKVAPVIAEIDSERFDLLASISNLASSVVDFTKSIEEADLELDAINTELDSCNEMMAQFGAKMIKCPSCGKLFSLEEGHEEHNN